MLDFDCDRQAKCDFTASTLNYFQKSGCDIQLGFWETTSAGTFVPFGSEEAFVSSREDVYMSLDGIMAYAFELKERDLPSDNHWTMDEGAFINPEKKSLIPKMKAMGLTPMWVELYTDGKIRVWNLGKIDADSLPFVERGIKRINIDPDSPKITQKRYLLPVSAATMIERIDEQRNRRQ